MKLTRKAYGKVNLFLSVGAKRDDGKHEVETVLCKVGVYDTVSVELTPNGGIVLICDDPTVPTDGSNLAVKAALAYAEAARIELNCSIRIEKRIPVTAGMGGGSSDAAAVLLMLSELLGKLNQEQLLNIASSLGSDVPFFMYEDKAMVGRGSGDIMTPCVSNLDKLYGVFVMYGVKESTGKAYALLDEARGETALKSSDGVASALKNNDIHQLAREISNDFEMCSKHLAEVRSALDERGCFRAFLCGSGPTVCGLFIDESTASEAAEKLVYPTFLCEI
ncbi:MAG: 4-(cytidine 5'-diphospho)-2-C-methyl-D-erythritol kinase [Clostridia bacterium]|nr:4-(cytidine 5'-diphospho)-2-C-methyl-D-erythritol kinase [Clostridia bacterium]